jgi:L-histidine Nalpha-methyltransferase
MSDPTSLGVTAKARSELLEDALRGLSAPQKWLPSKYFYDEHGSALFDAITELEEYYPTRTELSILQRHAPAMARQLGPDCALIEYGSGSSLKIRLLLDALDGLEGVATYVPIDISGEHLLRSAGDVALDYPRLRVEPVVGDFTQHVQLPSSIEDSARRLVYFPGSTIGNLVPDEAVTLLRGIVNLVGPEGGALIGVDLEKPRDVIESAYNDAAGVTAEFNLNMLRRINRELDGDFDIGAFEHCAYFNDEHHRVEMHLVSQRAQVARIADRTFSFEAGESIRTEYSHKYTPERFEALARQAGLTIRQQWTDDRDWFGVFYLVHA